MIGNTIIYLKHYASFFDYINNKIEVLAPLIPDLYKYLSLYSFFLKKYI